MNLIQLVAGQIEAPVQLTCDARPSADARLYGAKRRCRMLLEKSLGVGPRLQPRSARERLGRKGERAQHGDDYGCKDETFSCVP